MGGNRGTAVGRLPDTTSALKAFEIATPAGISPPLADAQERADIDPICDGDVLTAQGGYVHMYITALRFSFRLCSVGVSQLVFSLQRVRPGRERINIIAVACAERLAVGVRDLTWATSGSRVGSRAPGGLRSLGFEPNRVNASIRALHDAPATTSARDAFAALGVRGDYAKRRRADFALSGGNMVGRRPPEHNRKLNLKGGATSAPARCSSRGESRSGLRGPGFRSCLQRCCDVRHIFERAGCHAHDQVVGLIVAEREPDAVHAEERDSGSQRGSLVAVD